MRDMMKCKRFLALLCGAAVLISVLSVGAPLQAEAASSGEIKEQIDALEEKSQGIQDELAALEAQYDENYQEIEGMIQQKSNLDQQVTLLNQQIDVNNEQISAYTNQIAEHQLALDDAQTRYDELREKNADRIRAMEEEGRLSYWSVLFKSNSFADLLDRLNMIEEIAEADQRRMEELSEAAEEVSAAKEVLLAEKAALEQTRAELAEAEADLQVKRQEADAILTELVACGDEYKALIDESEDRVAELMAEIAQKEAEYNEAVEKEEEERRAAEEDAKQNNGTGGSYAPVSSGGWVMPCSYVYVSSPFNPGRVHPILGYARPHNGIDLAAYQGTPIYATRSGTVTTVDYQADGAGNYVSINHGDGFASIYMHMQSYVVSSGQYVSAGQLIGYVGSTGLSEGPHLHFGISYYGTYVNPANYINF